MICSYSKMCFKPNKVLLLCIIANFQLFETVTKGSTYHGMRLGDFPAPDFKFTIPAVHVQNNKESFKRVSLPSFKSVPDLVRVYASTQDGDSAGFRFEGTGACQNPGSSGNYGGIIFAYNSKEVRLWVPTKYSGNTNGKLIYVEDGWGGEKYTQSSRTADVTIEVWKHLITPNFQTDVQVDTSKSFYEIPHKLKQIPDFISVRVYARSSNSFDKNYLYHFHAAGATQSMSGSTEYGGVVFSYNETFVRLWLPNTGSGLKTGCILVTKGWGNGKYSKEMNSQTCQVEIRAWINAFPNPAFQTKWKRIRANAHQKSFREISHNIGTDVLIVQVQVKEQGLRTDGFVYEGLGSIQSTQSAGETYGGLLFAYDKTRIRIWAPSSDTGEKGRALFVSTSWGNGTHTVKHDKAFFRVRIYAHKCSNNKQIVDGQGLCRDAGQTGLVWKTSTWGNCSRTCSNGFQERKLSGCHAVDLETVLSCNFENDACGFTNASNFKWKRSRGSAEKITDLDGLTQPPSGFIKGSWFLYSVIQDLYGGSLVQVESPRIAARRNCILRFYYNTGVYFNQFEVHVLQKGKWYEKKWKMSDQQPGNPYIWYPGYLNLDSQEVEQFKFSLRLRSRCRKDCGYVALDDITLQCEAEKTKTLPLSECQKRATPIPGCNIDALQPFHKGSAYSIAVTETGTYVRARGKLSDHIATYKFRVEKDGYYHIWLDVLGANSRENGVIYIVDNSKQTKVNLIVRKGQPIWNRLDRQDLYLDSGNHLLLLMQYEYGFTYRNIIVAPRTLVSWSSLGMQNLHINDESFKCSMQLGEKFQEKNSLIRLNGQGAWETNDPNDNWLHWQIVFPDLALVNKVAIQGGCREPRDPVCCAADRFKLKFSLDGKYYSSYRNSTIGEHMFPGSHRTAPHYVVIADLEYAVPARGIRFYPYQSTLALTCLRVEVYGTYITKSMCTNTGLKPDLVRTCVGDRKCGKNAECLPDQAAKSEGKDRQSCQCSPGYHGLSCEFVGCNPNPCQKNGVCKIKDGSFKCFCSPGYTGKLCQLSCPANKFGPGCNENCTCSGRSHCHPITGHCVCDKGYTGENCSEPCTEGYYGENCERACSCSSLTVCDSVTGSCYCPLGFTGELCEKPCPLGSYGKNCSMTCRCSRHSKCLPENGTCICPPGWSGKYCEHECQDGKYGIGCLFDCNCSSNSLCNNVNGACSCKTGFVGKRCDQKCPQGYYGMDCIFRCKCDQRRTVSCHHETGCVCKVGAVGKRCEKDCKIGRYGLNCKQKCNCQNDAPCDSKDGTCHCQVGFIGKFCDSICPPGRYGRNCSGVCNCVSNQTDLCNYQDGTCDCMPGYKGKKCHKTCKKGTWGKNCEFQCYCYNEAYCDPFNGLCSCLSGWQGESCETPCDNGFFGPACKHKCNCQNGAFCDRFNGRCTCASGFIGKYCSEVCPKWKYGKRCKVKCSCIKENSFGCGNVNGSCFCKPGYQGITCQRDCDDGKYGNDCKHNCPSCPYHVAGACNKVTGRCRCAAGYHGERCQEYCPLDKYGILCESKCNCTDNEICNNIGGTCFSKEMHEFFLGFRFAIINSVSDAIRRNLTLNIEKFMAKYFVGSLMPKSSTQRRRRENNDVTTEGDDGSFEGLTSRQLSDLKTDIEASRHGATVPENDQDSGEMQQNIASVKSYQEETELDSTASKSGIISELKQILSDPIKKKDHLSDVLAGELADIYLQKQKSIQPVSKDSTHVDTSERSEFSEGNNPENSAVTGDKNDFSTIMFSADHKVYSSYHDVGYESSKYVPQNQKADIYIHDIVRREAINKTDSSNCVLVVSAKIVNSYSVRITRIEEKYDKKGKPVAKVGFVALHNGKPLSKDIMRTFMNIIPKDCLLEGVGCENCAYFGGKLYEKKPVQSQFNLWIIIGAVTGGVLLILAFALCLIVQRRRHNIAPNIYKVKKNSRDIELRPCLANGDGGHVLAFENPYYDVIAAMGLDDDIEEDYYNPLYTYDDVSLYCDDQATDSEPETNNGDGYQYPYDRDSGISSGTIHQG